DPGQEPGRLTLIARMGADRVADTLPGLVSAVHANGWPVIWLCDPMHGNTFTAANGLKTRLLSSVIREVRAFHAVVSGVGAIAGGLHLEATPDDEIECVLDARTLESAEPGKCTSLCDPGLNPQQAVSVATVWR